MAKKKASKKVAMTVRLEEGLHEKLTELSIKTGESINLIIAEALGLHADYMEAAAEFRRQWLSMVVQTESIQDDVSTFYGGADE